MHICVGNLTIIGSDNDLLLDQRQAIIWISDVMLLIGPLGTNFSGIVIKIITFLFKKMCQIQIQKTFIAIIHNMNTWGRSCIRLIHQITLQYTTQLTTENYTLSTVKHIKEKQIVHIMAMGARNPSRFMGSISYQHLMLIQTQVQGAKHFQGTLHTVISMSWHKAAASPMG